MASGRLGQRFGSARLNHMTNSKLHEAIVLILSSIFKTRQDGSERRFMFGRPGAALRLSVWRLGPIHHQARAASSADQPDSISHVRNIVAWRDVGTIEAAPASGTIRSASVGDSGADAVDFMRFELFGHMNGNSKVCFEPAK